VTRTVKRLLQRIRRELAFYKALIAHPRTPRAARRLLGLAVVYLLSPVDLIPDGIPILGQLDDLVIVPALVFLALRLIPKTVKEECRQRIG
jgi:uncharacterized membrane protein YkvA (DUF1232 family)